MRLGIHVVGLAALKDLVSRGALPAIPEPYLGAADLLRTLEGMAPEPARDTPLGIVGLDALLMAAEGVGPGQGDAVMRGLRASLHEARGYFEWRRIPLVFLVRAAIEVGSEGCLALIPANRPGPGISLEPLLGRGMQSMGSFQTWWWAAQPG